MVAKKELPVVKDEGNEFKTMFSKTITGVQEADIERMRRKDRKALKKQPQNCIVVTMHHRNHTTRTFIIKTNESSFEYIKKAYIIDMRHARNDLTRNLPHLHFTEDCSAPIEYDVERRGDRAWFSVTPETMLQYLKMEVVKAFVGSLELNRYLKMLVVITASTALCSIVTMLLLLNQLRGAVT